MLKGSTVLARRHGQVDDVTKGSQCIVIDRGIGAIQYVVSVCWTNNKRRVAQLRLLLVGDASCGHGSNDSSKHAFGWAESDINNCYSVHAINKQSFSHFTI